MRGHLPERGLWHGVLALAARLPWWLGVGLALASYLLLHRLALSPVLRGAPLQAVLLHTLAGAGQYGVPALWLLGAGFSGWRRWRAIRLHRVAATGAPAVAAMSWREFETLVGEYFRHEGFSVLDNGGGGPDGGVDAWLRKGRQRYLVQCKHWHALRVGVQPVRELYGVMAAHGAAGGFVVTSGDFTPEARRFAQGLETLQLIDGRTLQRGLRAQVVAPAPAGQGLPCPLCRAPMVLRQARQGAGAGRRFWGCSRYAQTGCRGTRELG